jgi:hypothetical protein
MADPQFNVERILGLAARASELKAAVALFPELGVSAYSNEDLFHQDALLGATETALARLVSESRALVPILIVGAPLRFEGKLFIGLVISPMHFLPVAHVSPELILLIFLPALLEIRTGGAVADAGGKRQSYRLGGVGDVVYERLQGQLLAETAAMTELDNLRNRGMVAESLYQKLRADNAHITSLFKTAWISMLRCGKI